MEVYFPVNGFRGGTRICIGFCCLR